MANHPPRDPLRDPLLTPRNAALVLVDYQPVQFNTVRSQDSGTLLANVSALAKTARLFGLPVVVSTVNVQTGINPDTVPALRELLGDTISIDRTSINAWEDAHFVQAIESTGRNKLIFGALWTEVCLAFPTLDALRAGYAVFPVVDAVGGTSVAAHDAAIQRVVQAGAQPVSWVSVLCELQRDWAHAATAPGMIRIGLEHGGSWGTELALKQFAAPVHPS